MFRQYVICQKRVGGTALIEREEFLTYKASQRKAEFDLILWMCSPLDEHIALKTFPRLESVLAWAHRLGFGAGLPHKSR